MDLAQFPDFAALSDEVFIFNPYNNYHPNGTNAVSSSTSCIPSTVMVFGWGDASPRNEPKRSARAALDKNRTLEMVAEPGLRRAREIEARY